MAYATMDITVSNITKQDAMLSIAGIIQHLALYASFDGFQVSQTSGYKNNTFVGSLTIINNEDNEPKVYSENPNMTKEQHEDIRTIEIIVLMCKLKRMAETILGNWYNKRKVHYKTVINGNEQDLDLLAKELGIDCDPYKDQSKIGFTFYTPQYLDDLDKIVENIRRELESHCDKDLDCSVSFADASDTITGQNITYISVLADFDKTVHNQTDMIHNISNVINFYANISESSLAVYKYI